MLKKILNYKFHIKAYIDPFIGYKIASLGNLLGVNEIKRETPIIISLTSYKDRLKKLPITLYSLLNQSLKPDRIILWLDEDSEDLNTLPYEITRLIKNGLEIKFRKDLGPYTKSYYAFKEHPESIIVTADDDIYYQKDWLKKLYLSYISHPEDIHVHRAHFVTISNKKIQPYENWIKQIQEENSSYFNFLTGVGGVLYPPKCFSKEVLRKDIFLKNAPFADDIWLWVMALVHSKKIRVIKNHYNTLCSTNIFDQLFNKTLFHKNKNGGNDKQLKNLEQYYGNNIYSKLSSF